MKASDAKRLKELDAENARLKELDAQNARLKKLVANQALDIDMLQGDLGSQDSKTPGPNHGEHATSLRAR
jgi:putative transposase